MEIEWRGKAIEHGGACALADAGAHGREWYADSGASLERYAGAHGRTLRYVADVVSILSPRVSVSQNVKLADEYITTGGIVRGVMNGRRVALARYESGLGFKGPKVTAFSAALQGDPESIVIDAWILRAFNLTARPADLRTARRIIRGAASRLSWANAETLAAIWVGVRAACGFADAYSPLIMPAVSRAEGLDHGQD